MYKTVLVKDLIEEGERVVQALEKKRFPFAAAFWYHDRGRMSWHLYIATKAVERQGPRNLYKRIYDALQQTHAEWLALDDFSLINPSSIKFKDLQSELGGVKRIGEQAATKLPKDAVLDYPYVYRWRPDGLRTS